MKPARRKLVYESLEERAVLSSASLLEMAALLSLQSPMPLAAPEAAPTASEQWAATTDFHADLGVGTGGEGQTLVDVQLTYPGDAVEVWNWGNVTREGNTFIVDMDVQRNLDAAGSGFASASHRYDLGSLPAGQYTFVLKSGGKTVRTLTFGDPASGTEVPGLRTPYVPTADQTRITIFPPVGQRAYSYVSLQFNEPGPRVMQWGTLQRNGNAFTVSAQVEQWPGVWKDTSAYAHFDLGVLLPGEYTFTVASSDESLKTVTFVVPDEGITEEQPGDPSADSMDEYVPTTNFSAAVAVPIASSGETKPHVGLTFNTSGYHVRDWGQVLREGNHFTVDMAVDHWTGGVLCAFTYAHHDYDLGTLANGEYTFTIKAWGKVLKTVSFNVDGSAQGWLPWAGETDEAEFRLKVTQHESLANQARWSIGLAQPAERFRISRVSEPVRDGNSFIVNVEVVRWNGAGDILPYQNGNFVSESFGFPIPPGELLTLQDLPAGEYTMELRAWGKPLQAFGFRIAAEVRGLQDAEVWAIDLTTTDFHADLGVGTGGEGQTLVDVQLTYPGDAVEVRNWGNVTREGNTFIVDMDVQRNLDAAGSGFASASHRYDLESLPAGQYTFILKSGGKTVRTRAFGDPASGTEVPGLRTPYVPTADQTRVSFHASAELRICFEVSFRLGEAGLRVIDWGTLQRDGNAFTVSAQIEQWPGVWPDTSAHAPFDLGVLLPGEYTFTVVSSGALVKTVTFVVSEDMLAFQRVDLIARSVDPTPTTRLSATIAVPITSSGETTPHVRLASGSIRVRDWGQVMREGNQFVVDVAAEYWHNGMLGCGMLAHHDYDLGTLANGEYTFTVKAWGKVLKTVSFTVNGSEQGWLPWAGETDETELLLTELQHESLANQARWSLDLVQPNERFCISRISDPVRDGNTLTVDIEIFRWNGAGDVQAYRYYGVDFYPWPGQSSAPTSGYLNNLPAGDYTMELRAWGKPLQTFGFRIAAGVHGLQDAEVWSNVAPLKEADAQPLLSAAAQRFQVAAALLALDDVLAKASVVVTDLPGRLLGQAVGNTIYLDDDAAGHGWFIDNPPLLDEEFELMGDAGSRRAIDPRAVDRIDLLSVVEHELGHLFGLDDLDDLNHVMGRALGPGMRRTKSA